MLLSRTAENLYWLGRHLERAESIARVVREHTNLLVDLPVAVDSDWSCLLAMTGSDQQYLDRYHSTDERNIVSFLVADIGNPTSVIRTVAHARENLRNTRQVLPRSAWESINQLHRLVSTEAGSCVARSSRTQLADAIVSVNQQVIGLLESTMSHDDAFMMITLGRLIERADMTTRVLDVRAGGLINNGTPGVRPAADRSPYEEVRWMGVLKALGAHHMYARNATGPTDGPAVINFLVDDAGFPRSISHCITKIEHAISRLPARERLETAVAATRNVVLRRPDVLGAVELHNWVDTCQSALCELHNRVAEEYFVVPDVSAASVEEVHPSGFARRHV